MAKLYKLYAMVYSCKDGSIGCVNTSYYSESMAGAQACLEDDLKARGMVPLSILSEGQVKKKLFDCIGAAR